MPIAIAVHGGAGPTHPDDDAAVCAEGCLRAARAGYAVLSRGGSALDAVVEAARALEDDPTFNAGTGSCLNADGEVEMDASVMSGADLRAGAVAAVRRVKNPVLLARAVMERTPHILLAADGAEAFARRQGVALVDPAALITPRAKARLAGRATAKSSLGTIGAVACDAKGHVAAATSTGGTNGKMPGRVGDTPVIGAGTFADDRLAAASATGVGEAILKVGLTRLACQLVGDGLDPMAAAETAIASLSGAPGDGGLIVLDRRGRIGLAFNTERMSRAWIDARGEEGAAFGPAGGPQERRS